MIEANKKPASQKKTFFCSLIVFSDENIINDVTIAVTKSSPPVIEATERCNPSGLLAAEKLANTSGAPFPKASRVTPANVSDKPSLVEICSKPELKNSSAVVPNM
jgi:hypothetical protein